MAEEEEFITFQVRVPKDSLSYRGLIRDTKNLQQRYMGQTVAIFLTSWYGGLAAIGVDTTWIPDPRMIGGNQGSGSQRGTSAPVQEPEQNLDVARRRATMMRRG